MLSTVHQFYAMASDCAVHLYGETAEYLELFAAAAEAEVRRIETRYSRYRGDSELARINKAAATGGVIEIDAETAALIAYAKACFAKSAGAFDITSGLLRTVWDFSASHLPDQASIDAALPFIGLDNVALADSQLHFRKPGMELDFGGLGKEYAADRAAEVCLDLGARHGFVDLGGDIRVIGPQPDGQPWRIGIRHPRDAGKLVAEIELANGALATSGDYERFIEVDGRRYCHILDPRTGWPARGLTTVTVISDHCLVAGSLSTAAMLKGKEGAAWLQGLGVRHMLIDENGEYSGSEPPLLTR
ncbi:MAG: FAD:protein FMN transferase [Bradyrhizobium sp.]|uniref:FAD:protein FMN transferase n=1 Tax=Bradyrhizobium sp. TaxID=376 RepID=UPI001226AA77|nr:FAD:protein FMN transferase [Bradyrhizobium sp.]THD70862.1 MAG: FAD:protein FMN transferase [Bradyrhizobium sp.]